MAQDAESQAEFGVRRVARRLDGDKNAALRSYVATQHTFNWKEMDFFS